MIWIDDDCRDLTFLSDIYINYTRLYDLLNISVLFNLYVSILNVFVKIFYILKLINKFILYFYVFLSDTFLNKIVQVTDVTEDWFGNSVSSLMWFVLLIYLELFI